MTTKTVSDGRHFDTVVLGAGISGLACASRLYQHQHFRQKNRLLVVEARDRLGGRIASVNINGSRLDTGANWIHGIGRADKPNPLMSILPHKRYRQLSGTVMFGVRDGDVGNDTRGADIDSGEDWVDVKSSSTQTQPREARTDEVIPPEDAGPLFSALWEIIGELHDMAPGVPADEAKQTSILRALTKTQSLRRAFNEISGKYHSTLSALPQFIESMEAAPLTAQSAEHPEDIPGVSLLEYAIDDFDGDQVFLQDGYTDIVEELAGELMQVGLIKTGTEVKRIDWSEKILSVETSKGIYTANNVICTLPLGVLQDSQKHAVANMRQNMFHPDLPKEKQDAIESLGFGTLDKIFSVYAHPWWTEEPYLSVIKKGLVQRPFDGSCPGEEKTHNETTAPDSFLGFTNELPGIALHQDGSTSIGPQRLSVMNLHALTGFPALSVFVACSTATQIESFTNEQTSGLLHRAFTKWFGHEPPNPVAVHVTRWAQDKFSRGSYSHMITGISETAHRVEFQRPVVNKHGAALRFAGEHTSRNHFATAHGALLSGFREADAIMRDVSS